MRLVFIYGPPAVGKLTVATELARQTGYHLFHNHLTVLPVAALFPERGPQRTHLLKHIRLELLTAAARADRNVIFTMAYSGTMDNPFVAAIVQVVKSYGGQVDFVQLAASVETLMERVENESRQRLGKIASRTDLRRFFAEPGRDSFTSVSYPHVLHCNTEHIKPEATARYIKEELRL